jgi:hypothetical protein
MGRVGGRVRPTTIPLGAHTMSWNPDRVLSFRKLEAQTTSALESAPNADPMLGAKAKASSRIRVGIWDMDGCAGGLPHLLDRVEEVQDQFSCFAVEAPFQTGLTAPGDHVAQMWRRRTGRAMSNADAHTNVLASPLYAAAKPVLKKLPIDWLVLIVRATIADDGDPKAAWYNLFSTHLDNTIIVSTYELRRFAAEAGRSFEAAVVLNVLSELLAAMVPDVEMKDKTTGSIFDYCEDRRDIVVSLKRPHIDPENRKVLPAPLLEAAEKMIEAIKTYKRPEDKREIRRARHYFETAGSKKKGAVPVPKAASRPKGSASTSKGSGFKIEAKAPPGFAFDALVKHLETLAPKVVSSEGTDARAKRVTGKRSTRTTKARKPRKET